jgi:hypothetical protein
VKDGRRPRCDDASEARRNEDVMVSQPVSKAVGNVKSNSPELLEETLVGYPFG